MNKPEDIPEWAWEKAREVFDEQAYPGVVYRNEGLGEMDRAEAFDIGLIARAILSAVEEENEACALESLRWEDGIDAAEHIRRRISFRKEA